MQLCQLTEYNRRYILFGKQYTKCVGEPSPRPFSKNSKLSMSLDQRTEILYSLFRCMSKIYCGQVVV